MNDFHDTMLGLLYLGLFVLGVRLVLALHGTGLLANSIDYANSYLLAHTYAGVK